MATETLNDQTTGESGGLPVELKRLVMPGSPNLSAVLMGCVSGRTAEWPGVREELVELMASQRKYYDFFSSVSCLFAEGVEFMTKEEIYQAIKKDWQAAIKA